MPFSPSFVDVERPQTVVVDRSELSEGLTRLREAEGINGTEKEDDS